MDKLVLVALFTVAVFVSLALSGVAIYTFRLFTSHPTARQRFLRELLFVGSLFAAVIVSPYVFRIGVFTQYNTPTYRLVFILIVTFFHPCPNSHLLRTFPASPTFPIPSTRSPGKRCPS